MTNKPRDVIVPIVFDDEAIPWPDGPWGIVFRAGENPDRPFALYTLAYGERHPTRAGKPSVYEISSQRLEEITATDLRDEGPDTPRDG